MKMLKTPEVRSPFGKSDDVARSKFQKHFSVGQPLEVEMSKKRRTPFLAPSTFVSQTC